MENAIKMARAARGFTQEQLAERIGVSAISVSQWENSNREPNATTLCKIADVLNVSTDQLLGRKPLIADS